MTKILMCKGLKKYSVSYYAIGSIINKYKTFKTIKEACDFSAEQDEYIDSCADVVVDWVKKNNHKIQFKGGFQEFCA